MYTIGIAKLEQTAIHYPTLLSVFIARLYLPICTLFWQSALYNAPYTALIPSKSGIMTREEKKRSYPQSDRFNRHSWLDNMRERDASNIRGGYEPIWVGERSYIGQRRDQYETAATESCPLFITLRHRAPSSPKYLSEVIRFSLRLIASIPLIQQREKWHSREEKAPSRSVFSASMYVVLKTKHVNPNIHARRY